MDDEVESRRVARKRFLELVDFVRDKTEAKTDRAAAKELGVDPTQISNTRREESRGVGPFVMSKAAAAAGVPLEFFHDRSAATVEDWRRKQSTTVELDDEALPAVRGWIASQEAMGYPQSRFV